MSPVKRALLPALLVLLTGCDGIREQREARKICEEGLVLVVDADARLSGPTLTPLELKRVRGSLTEAIIKLRAGLARNPDKGMFFDPAKYTAALARARTLLQSVETSLEKMR